MADRIERPVFGWLVWDKRFTADNLAANDGGTTESDYTESTPRPGQPVRTAGTDGAQVAISGAQSATVEVQVSRSGMPGRDSAGLIIRDAAEGTWLDWSATRWRMWEGLSSSDERFDIVCDPSTGRPVITLGNNVSYWSGSAWTTGTGETGSTGAGVALVAVPGPVKSRLIRFHRNGASASTSASIFSDDGGATWASYSEDCIPATAKSTRKIQAAYHRGEILGLLQADDTSGDIYQISSTDLGASFSLTYTHSAQGKYIAVTEIPGVGFICAYERPSDDKIVSVRLSSALSDLSDAAEVQIDSTRTLFHGLALCSTCDGILYAVASHDNTTDVASDLIVYKSIDYGESWEEVHVVMQMDPGTSSLHMDNLSAAWTAAGLVVLHNHDNTVGSNAQCSALWLGGWSNLYREDVYSQWEAIGWLPIDSLNNSGWTVTGTGSEAATLGGVELTGPIVVGKAVSASTLTTRFLVDVTLGSGHGSSTANEVYFKGTWGNGSLIRDYRLRLYDGGWKLFDFNAGAPGVLLTQDLAHDPTTRTQFRISASRILYRYYGESTWKIKEYSNGTTAGGATTGSAVIELTQLADNLTVHTLGADTSTNSDSSDEDVYRGRPCGGVPVWAPTGADGGKLALLDGPATDGTTWSIPPAYDYGIERCHPLTGQSPDSMWLSGVETEQILCYDLGVESHVGQWVGLYVARPRFQTAYLEAYNGSTWDTLATLDAGVDFDGLDFTRVGDLLHPVSTPSTDASRYLQAGELAGGWALYGSTPSAATIRYNAGGSYGAVTGPTRPQVYLGEGLTDPGGDSSGTCTLIAPQAYVAVSVGLTTARYWRVRIPAQDAPTGGIGAGLIMVGYLHAVGQEPDWSWSDGLDPNVARTRSPYGTPTTTQLGPNARTWSWGWTSGQLLTDLRSGLDIDYLRPDGGTAALVASQDVWMQLAGLLEITEGGSLPVVALRVIGDDDTTITDPTRQMLCEIEGGVAAAGMGGTEGTGEAVRVESITMSEVV